MASDLQSIGASEIIFPERETARRLAAQLINPNLLDFIPLEEDYRVMDVDPPNNFYGHTLVELDLRENSAFLFWPSRSWCPCALSSFRPRISSLNPAISW